jgi:hypothetical protein
VRAVLRQDRLLSVTEISKAVKLCSLRARIRGSGCGGVIQKYRELCFDVNSLSHGNKTLFCYPYTGLDTPRGFQEVEAPIFQDNRHMNVVRLSALRTGRLYPPRKYSWYSFLLEAESTPGPQCDRQDYVSVTIGNRTRDLPACSAEP